MTTRPDSQRATDSSALSSASGAVGGRPSLEAVIAEMRAWLVDPETWEPQEHIIKWADELASLTAAPPARPETAAPPPNMIAFAIQQSVLSPCRSKRGSVIFDSDGGVVGLGHNFKPKGFECDGSADCKATCRTEAIHAEQFALLGAGTRAQGAQMLHVKTVDGALVPSGGPSCVQCSKLGYVAGVSGIWLYHDCGWQFYDAKEWHRLSVEALTAAHAPQRDWQPIATAPKDGTLIIGALIKDGKVWRVHDMKHNGLAFYTVNGGSLPQMTHWIPEPRRETE